MLNCTEPSELSFSVSMCVYNGDRYDYFSESVASLVHQTVMPDEVVLVVDGPVSEELNREICFCENNRLFNVIRLPKNVGHGNARRIGLENCKNELVALMDADDISLPERFEKQLECFKQNPDISIVGGQISEFSHTSDHITGIRRVPLYHCEIADYMKKRCPMNQVSVMFKKSDVVKAGGYVDWFCDEDYYLWIRMFLSGMKFRNVEDILVNVRVEDEMYRRRGGLKYFISEAKLQRFMLNEHIIGYGRFFLNIAERFIIQVVMPNSIRGWFFKKFARWQGDSTNG